MRESRTSGSVGGALGNQCAYPDCAKKAQIVGISAKRRMKFSNVTQWVTLQ